MQNKYAYTIRAIMKYINNITFGFVGGCTILTMGVISSVFVNVFIANMYLQKPYTIYYDYNYWRHIVFAYGFGMTGLSIAAMTQYYISK